MKKNLTIPRVLALLAILWITWRVIGSRLWTFSGTISDNVLNWADSNSKNTYSEFTSEAFWIGQAVVFAAITAVTLGIASMIRGTSTTVEFDAQVDELTATERQPSRK